MKLLKTLKQHFQKREETIGGLTITKPMLAILHISEESERHHATRLQFPIRQILYNAGHLKSTDDYLIINDWYGEYSLANYCVANGCVDDLHEGVLILANLFKPDGYIKDTYKDTLPLANNIINQALEQNNIVLILTISKLEDELDFYKKKFPEARYREISFNETMSYYKGGL
ncbi:hypothetical protein [Lysinibacillus fusiformis]|uniref:hypothetical protein n=1 Tax=Lysinibacillus fusiformis TaxID=28031 RepID=UPI00187FE0E3|nr:hypothetical protein [Lysinibacillus fusiformis]MBD8523722.1 hypothetical protein [Lysinibacillus fusiformis]